MSDETEGQQTEQTDQKPAEQQADQKEPAPRPERLPEDQEWDRVDFETADAQTIQRRFNRLYASQKQTDAALRKAAEDNRLLMDRVEAFEAKQKEDSTNSRLAELKAEKKRAMEDGETDLVIDIDEQILDLKAAAKAKPEPAPKKEDPPDPGWFTPQRQQVLQNWASEMDNNGDYKRPWAHPDHPKNARCIEITNGVLNDPDFAGAEMDEILSEVDRLMAPRPRQQRRGAAVLPGGSAPRKSDKGGPKLSEEEKLVARRMYNHLSPNEAIKRYAESVAKLRGTAS